MSEPDFKRVGILGVGLIGGSLGGALKGLYRDRIEVRGYGRSEENLREALKKGLIDFYSLDPDDIARGADLLVLATPVSGFETLVTRLRRVLSSGSVVIDVGSVKGELVHTIESLLPEGVGFVGCHPIAGSEKSGAVNADPGLFRDALCVITPTEKTSQEVLSRVRMLWEVLGCRVVQMSPEEHDRVFGLISHLPHVLSYALVKTVGDLDSDALRFSGRGFRDTTRIAKSPPGLWVDICLYNRDNLLLFIDRLIDELKEIGIVLRGRDRNKLLEIFTRARSLRQGLGDDC